MKKIVCELCEGTDFVKDGGMFVCQGCGTKYSVEEARNMMREVECDEELVAVSDIGASLEDTNQAQIDNLLDLALTAYEADNYVEAVNYCNQALSIDATCYEAWDHKGEIITWQSKEDGNLRVKEAAHYYHKAIELAPEEEKEKIRNRAIESMETVASTLTWDRAERFSENPEEAEARGFDSDNKAVMDALSILLGDDNDVAQMQAEYMNKVAEPMNKAALAASALLNKAWSKAEHASYEDWCVYIEKSQNIENLCQKSIDVMSKDNEVRPHAYENLARMIEQPKESCYWKQEWDPYAGRSRWVKEDGFSIIDKTRIQTRVLKALQAAEEAKQYFLNRMLDEFKKADEEREKRIKAYWEEHAEEKVALQAEDDSLWDRMYTLQEKISELEDQLDEARSTGKLPSEEKLDSLNEKVKALESQYSKLGIFAGKEKRRINAEIASTRDQIETLKAEVEDERKARQIEVDGKVASLQAEIDKLNEEVNAAEKRVEEIHAELTKDPEKR